MTSQGRRKQRCHQVNTFFRIFICILNPFDTSQTIGFQWKYLTHKNSQKAYQSSGVNQVNYVLCASLHEETLVRLVNTGPSAMNSHCTAACSNCSLTVGSQKNWSLRGKSFTSTGIASYSSLSMPKNPSVPCVQITVKHQTLFQQGCNADFTNKIQLHSQLTLNQDDPCLCLPAHLLSTAQADLSLTAQNVLRTWCIRCYLTQ